VSGEPSHDDLPIARRNPLEVITDYLQEFDGGEPGMYVRPSAEALVRWLREEGWQISPIDRTP
jgi:phosphoserine phosphatase